MSDIHRSCDTLVESLQLKEGLSRQLYSCVARCALRVAHCAVKLALVKRTMKSIASRIASVGMIIIVVLNHQEDRGSRRA
jgi:hypothetical protein